MFNSHASDSLAKINKEWPFYDDLHTIWSELPNYNPIGVSSSQPGQDFAARAVLLFPKSSGDDASSGVEDSSFPDYNGIDVVDVEGENPSQADTASEGDILGIDDDHEDQPATKRVSILYN